MKASILIQDDRLQDPITWVEAYDPAYWQDCAEHVRKRADGAPVSQAAAYRREAADYERLARYAAALQIADEAA